MLVLVVILAFTALVAAWEHGRPPERDGATETALVNAGCPAGFHLTESTRRPGNDYLAFGRKPVDDNRDGRYCQVVTTPPRYRSEQVLLPGTLVVVDNDLPTAAVGKCPMSFTELLQYGRPEDLNGNGRTCEFVRSDARGMIAEVIIADDNEP